MNKLFSLFIFLLGKGIPKEEDPNLAWNNFVILSDPVLIDQPAELRSAAFVNRYWGAANGGGMNSFLTNSYELDAADFIEALEAIGAPIAAKQLRNVLHQIKVPLLASSQDQRWELLDKFWPEHLDDFDCLSEEANKEINAALEDHVARHHTYYVALSAE
jgi:hypothetical protein